jgi:CRISPR-associated protein Csb2
MPDLIIAWEYLTGKCVATDPASRERAEWPPHPGRVFMAMAAAWFETGEDEAEGQALRWLEKLGEPELCIPPDRELCTREVVKVFVPVNDAAGPSSALLQSAPITRSKQPRTFPSVYVGEAPCFLHWSDVPDAQLQQHKPALAKLCAEVTRIGHSSSLVRMWLAESTELSGETWVPDDGLSAGYLRRFSEGTLELLDRQFNRWGRDEYEQLSERISALKAEKPTGKGSKDRKAEIKSQLEELESQLDQIDARDPIRPKLGLWSGYRRKEAELPPSIPHANFDSDLLILTQVDGPRLPLASTLAVTQALRGAIMAHIGSDIPDWVSGHKPNGEPLRDVGPHLAIIPLPFVGSEYADGHLLGAALVFPRSVARPERGRVLGRFLVSETGQPRDVELTLGRLGVWIVRKWDCMEPRKALQPETWTALPKGAATWASVTPIVLDRFPKSDPFKDREAWQDEVAGIIATSCERLGLPRPVEVAVGTTSWHRGSPRAKVKRRPLRGHPEIAAREAALGDGFPPYPTKGGNGPRPQLHVYLQFAEPVVGPVLLCAGRFLGYGLCKPLWEGGIQ